MKTQKTLFFLFAGIAIVYLAASLADLTTGTFYLKPFLLVALMAATIFSRTFLHKSLLFTALMFCWTGDVLLLFAGRDAMYFILGLVAFLVGHIFYIFLFKKMIKSNRGIFRINIWALSMIGLYLIAFYVLMSPHLGSMLIPVMIYAVVISTMLYFAILLYRFLPAYNSFFILSGALAFVISDSILAVNKFYSPLPLSGFLIMLTYLYAQGAIVWGCLGKRKMLNA